MTLTTLKQISRLEIEELVQWESPEHETEVEEWLFRLIDRTYHATKEEVRGIIEKHEFQMDIKEYIALVKAWKGGYDVPFDDGYSHAKKDILAALEDTTTDTNH